MAKHYREELTPNPSLVKRGAERFGSGENISQGWVCPPHLAAHFRRSRGIAWTSVLFDRPKRAKKPLAGKSRREKPGRLFHAILLSVHWCRNILMHLVLLAKQKNKEESWLRQSTAGKRIQPHPRQRQSCPPWEGAGPTKPGQAPPPLLAQERGVQDLCGLVWCIKGPARQGATIRLIHFRSLILLRFVKGR